SAGHGTPVKLAGGFGFFWDYGTIFANISSGTWGTPPALASVANQGIGNIAQQLISDIQVRNLYAGDGEWLWDSKGQSNLSPALDGNNFISYLINESSRTPQFRFSLVNSGAFLVNWDVRTPQYAAPVGGQAVPLFDFTNVPLIQSFNVSGAGCSGGAQ